MKEWVPVPFIVLKIPTAGGTRSYGGCLGWDHFEAVKPRAISSFMISFVPP